MGLVRCTGIVRAHRGESRSIPKPADEFQVRLPIQVASVFESILCQVRTHSES